VSPHTRRRAAVAIRHQRCEQRARRIIRVLVGTSHAFQTHKSWRVGTPVIGVRTEAIETATQTSHSVKRRDRSIP
jgi:hypothetical protein